MNKDYIERLKLVLINETPILFLGAGFSLGAKTKSGIDIPKGQELKKIILEDFLKLSKESNDYKELIEYPLSQVCQYCSNKHSSDYLTDYLTNFFSYTQPSKTHLKLTNYFWKKFIQLTLTIWLKTYLQKIKKK